MTLQKTIKAVITPGDQSGYVAECFGLGVVKQGKTLDEVTANLREAVDLYLEGEDLDKIGLAANPTIVVTYEINAEYA